MSETTSSTPPAAKQESKTTAIPAEIGDAFNGVSAAAVADTFPPNVATGRSAAHTADSTRKLHRSVSTPTFCGAIDDNIETETKCIEDGSESTSPEQRRRSATPLGMRARARHTYSVGNLDDASDESFDGNLNVEQINADSSLGQSTRQPDPENFVPLSLSQAFASNNVNQHAPFQFGSGASSTQAAQSQSSQNPFLNHQLPHQPSMMVDPMMQQQLFMLQQQQLLMVQQLMQPMAQQLQPQTVDAAQDQSINTSASVEQTAQAPQIGNSTQLVGQGSFPNENAAGLAADGQCASSPFHLQLMQWYLPFANNNTAGALSNSGGSDQHHYNEDDEEDYEPSSLIGLIEDHHWIPALQRISTHPHETTTVGIQGRTPLHVAADHDAPAWLVQTLLAAWPEGAERVGTSYMNPLHITCSSTHASNDIVRVLLAGCRNPLQITGMKDVDGDTPLHAACRCAAPMDVLITLLQANPITVLWRDYEGLNPIMRLWVRYFVICGEHLIANVTTPSDLTNDLWEAWHKSVLLLQVMVIMQGRESGDFKSHERPFRAVHASSSVDCPRCVVRTATVLFPHELLIRDEQGRLPIHIAASSPVYVVHDLRGEGYTFEDAIHDDIDHERLMREGNTDDNQWYEKLKKKNSDYREPSVIDILLRNAPSAASQRDPQGQLPLHVAIMRGKTLGEGVNELVQAYPDALAMPDKNTKLYPFMLAASVGRGRGDCTTIYELLRGAPELVKMALTENSKPAGKVSKSIKDEKSKGQA